MAKQVQQFVVGDIHGGIKQLLRLEKKIQRAASQLGNPAHIYSCGDLIDRGPDSKAVLEHFLAGQKQGTHFFVLGNHELMMLEVMEAYRPELFSGLTLPPWFVTLKATYQNDAGIDPEQSYSEFRDSIRWGWIQQGGKEFLESFGAHPDNPRSWKIAPELLAMLLEAPFVIELKNAGEKIVITHGLPTVHDLQIYRKHHPNPQAEELEAYQQSIDNLIWNRELTDQPIDSEVWVSGHTPFEGIKRRCTKKVLQIDTGCSGPTQGALTAWWVQSNRFLKAWPKEHRKA
jgi:hypothetical protein